MAKQTVATTNERVDDLLARIEVLEAMVEKAKARGAQRATADAKQQPTTGVKCGRCTKKAGEKRYHTNSAEVRHCYMN